MLDTKLTIEPGITEIEPEAYSEEAWTEVILPATVKSIGAAAFMNCADLERVILPEGLTEIAEGAFTGCTSLTEIILPESLEVIGEMAFFGSGLRKITVPAGVKSVGEMAFWDCRELRYAEVRGKSTMLGKDAFGSDPKLREGYFAPGFPKEGNPSEQLLMMLVWCTAPERYDAGTNRLAEQYFLQNEELIMERILADNNETALRGLMENGPEGVRNLILQHREQYLLRCAELGKRQGIQVIFLSNRKENEKNPDTSFFTGDPYEL